MNRHRFWILYSCFLFAALSLSLAAGAWWKYARPARVRGNCELITRNEYASKLTGADKRIETVAGYIQVPTADEVTRFYAKQKTAEAAGYAELNAGRADAGLPPYVISNFNFGSGVEYTKAYEAIMGLGSTGPISAEDVRTGQVQAQRDVQAELDTQRKDAYGTCLNVNGL